MANAKKPQPGGPSTAISNCIFQAVAPAANEFTRDAVIALANAAAENAKAIAAIASALKGGNASMGTGIVVGGDHG